MRKKLAKMYGRSTRANFALAIIPGVLTTTTTELQLNFDASKMFAWAQMILDVMMPVIYITLGVSLAFVVIRALKGAFA